MKMGPSVLTLVCIDVQIARMWEKDETEESVWRLLRCQFVFLLGFGCENMLQTTCLCFCEHVCVCFMYNPQAGTGNDNRSDKKREWYATRECVIFHKNRGYGGIMKIMTACHLFIHILGQYVL